MVLDGLEENGWPEVVLLDLTNFWRRSGGRRVPAFHALMAYGYDLAPMPQDSPEPDVLDPDDDQDFDNIWATPAPKVPAVTRGRLLRSQVAKTSDETTWTEFLASWPGTPQVIVADGAGEIAAAVRAAWPGGLGVRRPERVNCRSHMAKNLRKALVKDIVAVNTSTDKPAAKTLQARKHPLVVDVEGAFVSARAYGSFLERVYEEVAFAQIRLKPEQRPKDPDKLEGARKWLRDNELAVICQIERRTWRPGPESTGPLRG